MKPNTPTPESILRERFGLGNFRPGQEAVIHALLAGDSALAVFPTGGGKSLCYQLPALLLEGVTIVISPLIALMKDQIDFLQARGIEAARLDSSLSAEEARLVEQRLSAGRLKLLYVAPERFNNERFIARLSRTRTSLFAVDEAHCISEWGHNFRPDYMKLAETARAVRAERVLALTATAPPRVVADICSGFGIAPANAVITSFYRPNLFLSTLPTPPDARDRVLLERIRSRPPGSGIVYVTLQRTAERVAAVLATAGIPARAYHAGMKDDERSAVQEWWKASDRAMVVATIAFGMGIDKAAVRYVYHYQLPKSPESYSQEIGRAGRDGLPAVVELLGSLDDLTTLENFAYGDTPTRESLQSLLADLSAQDDRFSVSLYHLGLAHDIRPLVLRTVLTYMELDGILEQGTPHFASYRVRLQETPAAIAAHFDSQRADFLQRLFGAAKKGRAWYTFDVAELAERLGEEKSRITGALGYLADRGWAEIQPSDVRHTFTWRTRPRDAGELLQGLERRFVQREAQEVSRLGALVDLISSGRCQTNALLAYFGEERGTPCGHCTACETGAPVVFPPVAALPPLESLIDRREFAALVEAHPAELGQPRQRARFLCGLSSPALTRAKLGRHALFGALQAHRFSEVLVWSSS